MIRGQNDILTIFVSMVLLVAAVFVIKTVSYWIWSKIKPQIQNFLDEWNR